MSRNGGSHAGLAADKKDAHGIEMLQVQGLLPLEPLFAQAAKWHCPPAYRNRRVPQRDSSILAGKFPSCQAGLI